MIFGTDWMKLDIIPDIWEQTLKKYNNLTAITDENSDCTFTYNDLYSAIVKLAKTFQKFGLEKGDKVAIFAENHPRWISIDQGIMKTGAVCVPRGSKIPYTELHYIYKHSDSTAFITDSLELLDQFLQVLKMNPPKFVIYIGEEDLVLPDDLPFSVLTYEQSLNEAENITFKNIEILPDDIALITYTSGTSGMPKGVMLTQKNLVSQIKSCNERIKLKEKLVFLSVLPLWHIGPRTYDFYFLSLGGTIVYVKYKNYIKVLKKIKPDCINCVPKVVELIYKEYLLLINNNGLFYKLIFKIFYEFSLKFKKALRRFDNTSIKNKKNGLFSILSLYIQKLLFSMIHKTGKNLFYKKFKKQLFKDDVIMISGAALLQRKIEDFLDVLDITMLIGYGLTEASPLLTHSSVGKIKYYSVGPPFEGTDIKIVDNETMQELQSRKTGLILAKGPQIMLGYYKSSEETSKNITKEGYLITGDRGWLTEDNYLVITGRYKDVIVLSNGVTIEPLPLEQTCLESVYLDQFILAGQDKPYLSALAFLNQTAIKAWADRKKLSYLKIKQNRNFKKFLIGEINGILSSRENYRHFEQIKNISFLDEPFNNENGFMTHTSKLKRLKIYESYKKIIENMYT